MLLKYCGAEIESASRGGGFGLQNQKLMRAGSVSVWRMQTTRGAMEDVCGKGKIWWLKGWGGRDERIEQGGALACKTENQCVRARFWSGARKQHGGPWRMSVGRVRYGD
jgi:hypothetical protein